MDDHVVCLVDRLGQAVERFTGTHTRPGLKELLQRLSKAGCSEIATGPAVAALLEADLTVISPNQTKNLRSRYGSAGNKDHRFDAYVLADPLRTDRADQHKVNERAA